MKTQRRRVVALVLAPVAVFIVAAVIDDGAYCDREGFDRGHLFWLWAHNLRGDCTVPADGERVCAWATAAVVQVRSRESAAERQRNIGNIDAVMCTPEMREIVPALAAAPAQVRARFLTHSLIKRGASAFACPAIEQLWAPTAPQPS